MNYVQFRRAAAPSAGPAENPDSKEDSSSHDQPIPPANGVSSREMLAVIAKLSEASIRDREEKVNLTLAACDSVRCSRSCYRVI